MNESDQNRKIWEQRYAAGKVLNKYPFDMVVSFVMRHYARSDRYSIRILDYGAGGGNHTHFLAQEGFDYYAIDFSKSAINHINERLIASGFNPSPEQLVCQDFTELPYRDNFFNSVIDRQSLDQNPAAKIPSMVDEIYRVLKPGGIYFGVNFSDGDPNTRYGTQTAPGDYSDFTGGTFKGLGQRHFFSENEIRSLFSRFVVIELKIKKVYSLLEDSTGSEEIILTAQKPIK